MDSVMKGADRAMPPLPRIFWSRTDPGVYMDPSHCTVITFWSGKLSPRIDEAAANESDKVEVRKMLDHFHYSCVTNSRTYCTGASYVQRCDSAAVLFNVIIKY